MKAIMMFLGVLCMQSAFSQVKPPPEVKTETIVKKEERQDIVEFCDVDAQFPGGMVALQKFLSENIIYPQKSLDKGEQGRVYLSFIIMADGSIENIQVDRGVSAELDREAKRLVSIMPNWIPGEYQGKNVNTRCRLPIVFRLH